MSEELPSRPLGEKGVASSSTSTPLLDVTKCAIAAIATGPGFDQGDSPTSQEVAYKYYFQHWMRRRRRT